VVSQVAADAPKAMWANRFPVRLHHHRQSAHEHPMERWTTVSRRAEMSWDFQVLAAESDSPKSTITSAPIDDTELPHTTCLQYRARLQLTNFGRGKT
jgi:hypothetical protein